MKKIMLVFGLFVIMQNQVQSQRPVGPRPDQMPGQRPDTSGVKKDIPPKNRTQSLWRSHHQKSSQPKRCFYRTFLR